MQRVSPESWYDEALIEDRDVLENRPDGMIVQTHVV